MSSQFRSKAPEFLADLLDHATAILVDAGIDADIAARVAEELSDRMRKHWGGQQIYFPMGMCLELSERDLQIWHEFNGTNHASLARKHRVSLQHIYRIIRAVRSQEVALRQKSLPID